MPGQEQTSRAAGGAPTSEPTPIHGGAGAAEHLGAPQFPADDGDLFDWPLIGGYARLILTAPLRHPLLAAALFALTAGVAWAVVATIPRTYHTEAKILASRNLVMPALGNPNRAIPSDADAPTRAAPETILRRDNLLVLMEQTDLLRHWEATRAPLARLADSVRSLVNGPADADEKRDALVYVLERRLRVWTGDGTIQIEIDWPDAKMGYQLVTLAQMNFLETRHAIEVSTIAEAISILEGHAAAARTRVDTAMVELRRERDGHRARAPAPAAARPPREASPSSEAAGVRLMLVAKRQALRDLESYRQRRLAELQAQLAEQKSVYTPQHPVLVGTRESIEALQKESPQLASLRREERDLHRQYLSLGGTDADLEGGRLPGAIGSGQAVLPAYARETRKEQGESETAQYWRTQLDYALMKYESLVGRIEAARIELDSARAAFKYRYTVVRPAEISKKPSKPNIPLLVALAVAGGICAAFAGTALLDYWRRSLLQAWQVEGQLHVRLLARIKEL